MPKYIVEYQISSCRIVQVGIEAETAEFESNVHGHPIDCVGEPLEGQYRFVGGCGR